MKVRIFKQHAPILVFLYILQALMLTVTPSTAGSHAFSISQAETYTLTDILVEDIFGRQLNSTNIILVDWEGYISNPAIKIFIIPPANATFPGTAMLTASGTRLYFDLPSEVGTGGPSKAITFADASPQPIYLSIFPDRDTIDENYSLTIDFTDNQNMQASTMIDIHVTDQDKEETETLQIIVDFSQDQTSLFDDPQERAIVQQVAEDWAYFFDDMQLDVVPAGAEQTFIWDPDGFNTGNWVVNANSYAGFLLYAYGNQNDELRSGGGPSLNAFQTSGGIQLPLRRSGGIQMHTDGNFNTLGWFLTTGDDDWWVSGNLGNEPNDFYSIVHHEMGHALFFNPGYPVFEQAKMAGAIDDSEVSAYHGSNPQIDQFDHFVGEVDKASKRGAYGNEYFGNVPRRRWLTTKLDLLIAQAIGYDLRETSPFMSVSISTSALPLAGLAEPYTVALQAAGGIPFYNWAIESGTLPDGLSLNSFTGVISGTPNELGSFNFTVRLQDYDESDPGVSIPLGIIVVEDLSKVFLPLISARNE